VIDGHRDSSERVGISLTRANNARDYMVTEKGVDSARITVRNFGDTCPHEKGDPLLNRRVEMWILPEGATLSDVDAVKRCRPGYRRREITDELPAQPEPARPGRPKRPEPIGAQSPPETAYEPRYSKTADTPSERPLSRATVVRSVTAQMIDGALHVAIETDGTAQFKDFILTAPSRIVIDLAGVRSASGSKTIPVAAGPGDRVRVGEPEPGAVRVVIDVKTMTHYRVMRDGASLIVVVGGEGVAARSAASR
jgi:hypothetical protein